MNSALVLEPADNLVIRNCPTYFYFRYRLPKYIYLPTYQEFWPLEVGSACLVAYQPLHIVGHLKSINIPTYAILFNSYRWKENSFIELVVISNTLAYLLLIPLTFHAYLLLRDGFATGGLNFNLFFAKGYCLSKQKILKYTMVQFKSNVDFQFLACLCNEFLTLCKMSEIHCIKKS